MGRAIVGAVLAMAIVTVPRVARADDKATTAVIASAVATGVAGLVGAGFLIAHKAYNDAADDRLAELVANASPSPCQADPAKCRAIDDNLESVDDAEAGYIASFATAGGLAAMTVVAIVVAVTGDSKKKSSGDIEIEVQPLAGPSVAGMIVSASF